MRRIGMAAVFWICLSGVSHATPISILGGSGSVHIEGASVRFTFSGLDEAGNVYQGSAAASGFGTGREALPGETLTYQFGLLGTPGFLSMNDVPFDFINTGWSVTYTGSVTLPSVWCPVS